MNIYHDYSLLKHNTFGIEATAAHFAEYETADELRQLLAQFPCERILHIGEGSNLLFLAPRFEGLVLHSVCRSLEVIEESEADVLVRVGAGWNWDEWVDHALSCGWYGLENLSLIPGEVGASAVQNIGAYGREAGEFIESVRCLNLSTGEMHVFDHDQLQYAYRYSMFKSEERRGKWAVLTVDYRLSKHFSPCVTYGGISAELERRGLSLETLTARQLRDLVISIRQAKLPDPKEIGSAGSFFMNPVVPRAHYEALAAQYPAMPHYDVDEQRVKIPAGWMIEQCGWKGRTLGAAGVHDRQALVLINRGGATGADMLALCEAIRTSVAERFGIDIHPEVNFIGEK
ncbi:MAG: UDP-N-acetylmuramate dehydrogenase [Bacteroidaceae bacterium]|nr:UDP-N-acetylmuramate dehydrogenase [Bacteroidaceae bacterium]